MICSHTDGTLRLYGSDDFEIPFLFYLKNKSYKYRIQFCVAEQNRLDNPFRLIKGNKFKVPPKKLKFTPKNLLSLFHNCYD